MSISDAQRVLVSDQAQLRITEIFYSLQGEANTVGCPTVFIRLTGCPLRCTYCDTEYAFSGGDWLSLDEIIETSKKYATKYITVTGGEPLAQPDCLALLTSLCDQGFDVSLETSGALSLAKVDPRVKKVMDLKTPGSGESERNLWENINYLRAHDQVKFVICTEQDYLWSKQQVAEYQLNEISEVLFSPSYGEMDYAQLADWILRDQLPVRFQIQLHKVLWGDQQGK